MKFSNKNLPPAEYVAWLRLGEQNPDWSPTYRLLQNPQKAAVLESLCSEQGYVCCYCGRRLEEGDGHIDHFWPQTHFDGNGKPDLRLQYGNFFCSCGPPGKVGVPTERPSTCGDAKGHWYDEIDSIVPSDPGCEVRFNFGQSGKISAAQATDQGAIKTIDHLALDDLSLDIERAVIIAEVEAALNEGRSAEEELRRLRTRVDNRLPGFGHVAARYLEVEFGLLPKGYE